MDEAKTDKGIPVVRDLPWNTRIDPCYETGDCGEWHCAYCDKLGVGNGDVCTCQSCGVGMCWDCIEADLCPVCRTNSIFPSDALDLLRFVINLAGFDSARAYAKSIGYHLVDYEPRVKRVQEERAAKRAKTEADSVAPQPSPSDGTAPDGARRADLA